MRDKLVRFSTTYPRAALGLILVITALFAAQLPKIKTDTDPKHMLPATSPVRVYNDQVERWFGLHPDMLVLGIANDQGILNAETLEKIAAITQDVLKIPGVIVRDTLSLSTVDNITSESGQLVVKPALAEVPRTTGELERLGQALLDNPLLRDRFISSDKTTTAIYIPIEPTANGKLIADQIRAVLTKYPGRERFCLAGDPVARDTFGAEMFRQMGLFSPIAGIIMCVALYVMFRNKWLVIANMAVAMVAILWAMGALIGAGLPVHIMSSMIPVFLMAISTDNVHIFNEVYFRFQELKEKRAAIHETLRVVGPPVIYSDLTTAVGFASLAFGHIIPVRVFGLFVALGTLAILLMSFTFVPALMSLVREEQFLSSAAQEDVSRSSRGLASLGRWGLLHRKLVLRLGLLLLVVSGIGISRIRVNNNMVAWFKAKSDIRQADRLLNEKLGGTSLGYLVVSAREEGFFKRPEALRYLEALQREVEKAPRVGKTISVTDFVKRIHRVLHQESPAFDQVPDSQDTIAQYLFLSGMSGRASDLDNVVDYPYQKANILVQLKSWDAGVMRQVIGKAQAFVRANPLPGVEIHPAGIAYFNMVWNDEVLWGMVGGFLMSLVLVLGILIVEYRSFFWGILSFVPLLGTILVIYSAVGFLGKDFDMPISVLSTLSLGMAIDFAIHFVSRFRQRYQEEPRLREALLWTVARPGKGIIRNAVLFALGFAVMVFASLTPYITVGVFMAAIMILSSLATLVYLPALIDRFRQPLHLE